MRGSTTSGDVGLRIGVHLVARGAWVQGAALLARADLLENDIAAEAEVIINRFMDGDMQDVIVAS